MCILHLHTSPTGDVHGVYAQKIQNRNHFGSAFPPSSFSYPSLAALYFRVCLLFLCSLRCHVFGICLLFLHQSSRRTYLPVHCTGTFVIWPCRLQVVHVGNASKAINNSWLLYSVFRIILACIVLQVNVFKSKSHHESILCKVLMSALGKRAEHFSDFPVYHNTEPKKNLSLYSYLYNLCEHLQ